MQKLLTVIYQKYKENREGKERKAEIPKEINRPHIAN
jgi:hypothetical protein